jgi:acetyl-CoA decarbonylase/synthase, CODH/ACS complex subunit gamma
VALSGLQIFKLLPKTNCKDCGYPTCMAFALQLAAGKTQPDACPHLAPSALATLADVALPAVRRVEIGPPDDPTVLGEETVLHRHERRFVHPTALAFMVDDSLDEQRFEELLEAFSRQRFERVGQTLRPRLVAIGSSDAGRLASRVKTAAERTAAGIVIVSDDPGALLEAGEVIPGSRPLLCGANRITFDRVAEIAEHLKAPFVLRGRDLQELRELGQRAVDARINNVMLEPVVATAGDALAAHVFARRAAVRDKVKALGFPTIAFACRLTDDPPLQTVVASALVAKYAAVIVIDTVDPAHTLPLLALTQGLYTDPQKPMMVDAGIYALGEPGPNSPVLLTTNFSLTYYTVIGEVENSKVPAWLLVMDVEGQSVLTAWAAGKFVADAIAPFVKKSGIEEKVAHRRLVIPGYVAGIQSELETELVDWEVVVGVREASDIPRYLRALTASQ